MKTKNILYFINFLVYYSCLSKYLKEKRGI